MTRQKDTQEPTLRDRLVAIETDMRWVKRAVLGLYGLFGSLAVGLAIAVFVALTKPGPVHTVARAIASLFT